MTLSRYFSEPKTAAQRQYEAVRAIVVDSMTAEEAATKFDYSVHTLHSLMRDARAGKIELFPAAPKRGPKQRHTPDYLCELVVSYRKTGLSCADIATKITAEGYKISVRTVENIVADAKLPRLPR